MATAHVNRGITLDKQGTTAQTIRAGVAAIHARDIAADLEVTASVGVALAQPDETARTSVARRADAAPYAAKSGGRNHVVLATA